MEISVHNYILLYPTKKYSIIKFSHCTLKSQTASACYEMVYYNSQCGSNELFNEIILNKLNSIQEYLFSKQYLMDIIKYKRIYVAITK